MPACSRCLTEVSPGTALCPKCGAAIRPTLVPRPSPKRPGKARQRLERMLESGGAHAEIAKAFGISLCSVGRYKQRLRKAATRG